MTASAHSSLPLTMFPRVRNAGVQRGSWSFEGPQDDEQTQGRGNGCVQIADENSHTSFDRSTRVQTRGRVGCCLRVNSFGALGYAALPLLKCTRGVCAPSLQLSIRQNCSVTSLSQMKIFHSKDVIFFGLLVDLPDVRLRTTCSNSEETIAAVIKVSAITDLCWQKVEVCTFSLEQTSQISRETCTNLARESCEPCSTGKDIKQRPSQPRQTNFRRLDDSYVPFFSRLIQSRSRGRLRKRIKK